MARRAMGCYEFRVSSMSLRARLIAGLAAAALGFPTGCAAPIEWLAGDVAPTARAPEAPQRCGDERLQFRPRRSALLGNRPAELWSWARHELPTNFRHGRDGRIALIPTTSPGVALHASLRDGTVAAITIQSHAESEALALPLARDAVARFLVDATGCGTYTLCRALSRFDEIRFRGYTTCGDIRVPLELVTPPSSRDVVSVATWLPGFGRARRQHRQSHR
jgi:hypothetical protein